MEFLHGEMPKPIYYTRQKFYRSELSEPSITKNITVILILSSSSLVFLSCLTCISRRLCYLCMTTLMTNYPGRFRICTNSIVICMVRMKQDKINCFFVHRTKSRFVDKLPLFYFPTMWNKLFTQLDVNTTYSCLKRSIKTIKTHVITHFVVIATRYNVKKVKYLVPPCFITLYFCSPLVRGVWGWVRQLHAVSLSFSYFPPLIITFLFYLGVAGRQSVQGYAAHPVSSTMFVYHNCVVHIYNNNMYNV